ncbi:hypothetical protein CUMW_107140 [Citrus unshiu]|nr:hypothetical protein CUMW_107140 [Citrus unshiu]
MNTSIANFKLMKVLDLEDAPVDYLPEGVGNLFNLHYLSVKNTKVKIIPKSIGNLLGLETLDLKNTLVRELPVEIRNLKRLRYLMVYQYNHTAGVAVAAVKLHEGFGSLTNLQKLGIIEADSEALKELMKLRLGLDLSGLTEDPIRVRHALPNLLQLKLTGTHDYELFHFEAENCGLGLAALLMEIPIGIEHLKNLKLLKFSRMVKQVYYMTKDENWGKVTEHIPDVLVTFVEAGKWFHYRKEDLSSLSPEYVEQIC